MSAATILMPCQLDEAKERHAAIEQRMRARQASLMNLDSQKRRLEESRSGYVGNRERWLRQLGTADEARAMKKIEVAELAILDVDRRLEAVNLEITTAKAEIDTLGKQVRELGKGIARVTRAAELDKSIHELEAVCERVRRLLPDLALALGDLARVEKEIGSRFDADGRRRCEPIVRALFDALWDRNSKAMAEENVFGSTVPAQVTIMPMRRA